MDMRCGAAILVCTRQAVGGHVGVGEGLGGPGLGSRMSSKGMSLNFPQSLAEEQWEVSTWCVGCLGILRT